MPKELPPAVPPAIVKPRKHTYTHRQVIAVTDDNVKLEDGRVFSADQLPAILCAMPSTIISVQGFGAHLQQLEEAYRDDPAFDYRVTPVYRNLRVMQDGRDYTRAESCVTLCNYVGWRGERKQANRYHYPLDPIHFAQGLMSIDDLDDSDRPRLDKLLNWGLQVREWCRENELQVKPSAGGLAAQLLRDPRFYTDARRKAPHILNRRARWELPGNYYRLYANHGEPYDAIQLDMENAHHYAAVSTQFPDVNSLHAYGNWASDDPPPFAPADSPLLKLPGLFRLRIWTPSGLRFAPPFMERAGEHTIFAYSNELSLISELGGEIRGVCAAYVGDKTEPSRGLSKYARYALAQIRKHPELKPWLKPTLHAAYGLLAARPVPFETGYYRTAGDKGTPSELPMGNHSIPCRVVKRETAVESKIVNVIHRGMIEARIRADAIRYALFLEQVQRYEVLSIYADSIFIRDRRTVDDDGNPAQIRLIEPPWRETGRIRHIRFHSPTHYTSPSVNRMPGIPRNARERWKNLRELGSVRTAR